MAARLLKGLAWQEALWMRPTEGWNKAIDLPTQQTWVLGVRPEIWSTICCYWKKVSKAEKGGLWEGVVQEPLRRALFCVFLCSEVIFSSKSHRNFFQKLPLQCRHFLENPLAKKKTQNAVVSCWKNFKHKLYLDSHLTNLEIEVLVVLASDSAGWRP